MRWFLCLVCVFLLSIPVFAQEYAKAELYGGFQSMHEPDLNLLGFRIEAARNFNPIVGLIGEFSFGKTTRSAEAALDSTTELCFLGGPRFSYRAGHFRLFAHALAGAAHLNLGRQDEGWSFTMGRSTGFAAVAGFGVDMNLSNRLSVRPVQFDWMTANIYHNGDSVGWANQMRYSGGIVLKLGQITKR